MDEKRKEFIAWLERITKTIMIDESSAMIIRNKMIEMDLIQGEKQNGQHKF